MKMGVEMVMESAGKAMTFAEKVIVGVEVVMTGVEKVTVPVGIEVVVRR